jgi:hypothetical protein
MHSTGRPEGRVLTSISEPCGHRLSGDEAGFGALASDDAITGINRADSANEILCSPAKFNDLFCRLLAARDANPTTHLLAEVVTVDLN